MMIIHYEDQQKTVKKEKEEELEGENTLDINIESQSKSTQKQIEPQWFGQIYFGSSSEITNYCHF